MRGDPAPHGRGRSGGSPLSRRRRGRPAAPAAGPRQNVRQTSMYLACSGYPSSARRASQTNSAREQGQPKQGRRRRNTYSPTGDKTHAYPPLQSVSPHSNK
eukprot:scaffold59914_cov49-Phaeocystis_antarctica.AAC.3